MKYLVRFQYQLVIIDVSPEKGDGFRALNKVREFTTVPILTISTNGESNHIVQTLAAADEIHFDAPPILSEDNILFIYPNRRKVVLMDVEITMPRKQFDLLYLLAGNTGRIYNTLNCQMRSLRSSLKAVSNAPEYLHTMRGVGYYFDIKQK